MDISVVEVELLQVAGHTYRLHSMPIDAQAPRRSRHAQQQQQQQLTDWEAEEELVALEYGFADQGAGGETSTAADGTAADEDAAIQQAPDGSWSAQVQVDPSLFGHVIGRGGAKRSDLEAATGTSITCGKPGGYRGPQQHHHRPQQSLQSLSCTVSEPITIKGPTRQAVSSGRARVQLLLDSILDSRLVDWSHFVSIPLASDEAAAKLQKFQATVLSQPDAAKLGFEPSIFIPPQRLHLTLLMLKLVSDDARQRAAATLAALKPQVDALLGGQPLRLGLQGLSTMGDDPTDVHVLYAKVVDQTATQCLTVLCDLVLGAFNQAGLVLPGQPDRVKLHATIINTRHRRPSRDQQQQGQQGQPKRQQHGSKTRRGVNGSALLQEHAGLDLGTFEVPALHISQRGCYDKASGGYYAALSTLPLGTGAAEAGGGEVLLPAGDGW